MEELASILGAIAMGIAELFLHASLYSLEFIGLVLMALFSPRYRTKLKARWTCSWINKIGMVLGAVLYLCGVAVVVIMLSSWFAPKPKPVPLLPNLGEKVKKGVREAVDVEQAVKGLKEWKKARDAKRDGNESELPTPIKTPSLAE